MDDQTKRVFLIMKEKNMNATQFSKAIGIHSTIISQIKKGRNKASSNVLTRIINRFTDINPDWLMTGKGTMKMESEQPPADLFEVNRPAITIPVRSAPDDSIINKPAASETGLTDKEVIIYKERPVRAIEKLVIFYSDKTYETFVSETHITNCAGS